MADIAKINGLNLKDTKARADIDDIKDGSIIVETSQNTAEDDLGQNIAETYIKNLSVSGRMITYTKGDGKMGTITTQDTNTTYGLATTSASGLMSAADKTKLNGLTGAGTWTAQTRPQATTAKAPRKHPHPTLNSTWTRFSHGYRSMRIKQV